MKENEVLAGSVKLLDQAFPEGLFFFFKVSQ